MNLKQILELEANNTTQIHLYSDGMFFNAYEHSAYALHLALALHPMRKESIALGVSYVIAGFLCANLDYCIDGLDIVSSTPDYVVLEAPEKIDIDMFEKWKKSVELDNSSSGIRGREERINGKGIIEEIEMFDLNIHTPNDCMMFLADIKARMSKNA